MYINQGMTCCGIREIAHLNSLSSAAAAMKQFIGDTLDYAPYAGYPVGCRAKFRYVIFSVTYRSRKRGDAFAQLITDNKLGKLVSTGYHRNPNSSNRVRVWTWTVDWDAVKRWKAKHMKPPAEAQPVIVQVEPEVVVNGG